MVVYSDATGGDVSCSSTQALEWFNKGLIAYVAVRESSLPYFKAALQQDKSFVLAHCILVRGHVSLAIIYSLVLVFAGDIQSF